MSRVPRAYSAGGIVVAGDKVLLVHENGTFWGFPKGRTEPDESLEQTAIREIIEETGLSDVTIIRKLGSYLRSPLLPDNTIDTSHIKEITLFLCRTTSTAFTGQHEPNITSAWIDKDKVASMLTHPTDREFYESIDALT